jgi:hypothetical protein
MKTHTINTNGIQQIVEQLKAKCKPSVFNGWLDDDLIDSRESKEMLSSWASDLEAVLDQENGDEIEISEHHTISGHTEFLSVTDEGIDIENDLSEMHTYYFSELQNRNSYRQAEKIRAASLADAQRIALSQQYFQGWVIEIGDNVNDDGFILNPTCIYENGRWDYLEGDNQ